MKPRTLSASYMKDDVSTGSPSRLSMISTVPRKVVTPGNGDIITALSGCKIRKHLDLDMPNNAIVSVPTTPLPDESEASYENTYKMGPDFGQKFAITKIQQIALDILKTEIGDSEYSIMHSAYLSRTVSEKIKSKVKELNLARYKIVCQVLVTDISRQGLKTASRCLWEPSVDNFTTATYSNNTICAIAMVFGIYFD